MDAREYFARLAQQKNKLTASIISQDIRTEQISCDDIEIENFIIKWLENEGWKFEHFEVFAKLIGLKAPIKLRKWNEKEKSFKCVTADNEEVSISLFFGKRPKYFSEIQVTQQNEVRNYRINSSYEKYMAKPMAILQKRTITKNDKELISFYCEFFCDRILTLDATHLLEIEIDEPNGGSYDKPNAAVLRNYQEIEEYLLSLDNSLIVTKVYDKIIEFLEFTDEDIINSKKILISHIETVDKEEKVLGKILIEKGEIYEYIEEKCYQ